MALRRWVCHMWPTHFWSLSGSLASGSRWAQTLGGTSRKQSDLRIFLFPVPPLPGCHGWQHPLPNARLLSSPRAMATELPLHTSRGHNSLLFHPSPTFRSRISIIRCPLVCTGILSGTVGQMLFVLTWLSLDSFLSIH